MSWATIQYRSESIGKDDAMNVLLPEGRGPFPVLYLLHGLSDNYSSWQRRTSIERYAAKHRLIVVMPNGYRSWYVNDARPAGRAYEDHILKDTVGYIDRLFPTIRARRGRAVAGLSMGGYGAAMLALKNPNMFSVSVGHSGAYFFAHRIGSDPNSDIDQIASALPKGKYDLYKLARQFARSRSKLHLRIDCGREDFLIEDNRDFHKHLDQVGVAHEYEEFPGAHTWEYWDLHIQETLQFVMKHLAKK